MLIDQNSTFFRTTIAYQLDQVWVNGKREFKQYGEPLDYLWVCFLYNVGEKRHVVNIEDIAKYSLDYKRILVLQQRALKSNFLPLREENVHLKWPHLGLSYWMGY